MYSHGIICANGVFIPDALINLVNRKNLALVFHQKQQDIVLNRRKLHRLVVHKHFLQIIVNDQPANLVDPPVVLRRIAKLGIAPKLGFHPRHQLQRVKRLCHIIVRTDIQPQNLVRIFGFR